MRFAWLAAAALTLVPHLGVAQVAEEVFPLRLDLRLGGGQHTDYRMESANHLTAEVVLRTRGPVVVGASAGIIDSFDSVDDLVAETRQFDGETVEISGGADFEGYSPRVGGLIGYALQHRGAQFELTAEGGWVRGRPGAASNHFGEAWHPWGMGAFAVRSPSGFGMQIGLGRYRSRTEYHSWGGYELRHAFDEWKGFGEFLVSVPLI